MNIYQHQLCAVTLVVFLANFEKLRCQAAEITVTPDILRKGILPSKFGNPVEDDEAYATAYDGPPEDPNTAPGCPARTFQLPWIFHGNPERCFLAGHKGPCSSRMKLYARHEDPVRGTCDCDDAGSYTTAESYLIARNKTFCIHEKRNLAYYPPKRRCYHLFERGPCNWGEWLIINNQGRVECQPRRCPKNLFDTTSYRTPYWYYDPSMDECFQAYTKGYCPKNHLLIPTKLSWIPQCINTKVTCDDLLPATVAIPTLRCSEGSYCSQILYGRKNYYTRSRLNGRRRNRSSRRRLEHNIRRN